MTENTEIVVITTSGGTPSSSSPPMSLCQLRLPAEEMFRIATVVAGLVNPHNMLLSVGATNHPLMSLGDSSTNVLSGSSFNTSTTV